jgi:hypothetical protein
VKDVVLLVQSDRSSLEKEAHRIHSVLEKDQHRLSAARRDVAFRTGREQSGALDAFAQLFENLPTALLRIQQRVAEYSRTLDGLSKVFSTDVTAGLSFPKDRA